MSSFAAIENLWEMPHHMKMLITWLFDPRKRPN